MRNGSEAEESNETTLADFGPGVITGAADDDPSGIATYSQAGAALGYGLLWTLVASYPLMVAIQVISARVGRVTGRGLAGTMKEHCPRYVVLSIVVLLFIANTINIAADLAAMGESVTLIMGGSNLLYATGLAVIMLLTQVFLDFRSYSKYLKILTLVLLAYVAAMFTVHVDWSKVALHSVVPYFHVDARSLGLVVAIFGTTISPYMFFWQATQEAEDIRESPDERPLKHPEQPAKRHLHRIKLDTRVGMAMSNIVGFFIMVTAAASLHAAGNTQIESASQAAEALKPLAGDAAFYLFALGIVGTGLLAVPVLAASSAYAAATTLGWKAGLGRTLAKAPGFYGVITLGIVIAIGMDLMHFDAFKALVVSAVINGVIAVPIMAVLVYLASRHEVMGDYTATPRARRAGWIATGTMTLIVIGMFVSMAFGG